MKKKTMPLILVLLLVMQNTFVNAIDLSSGCIEFIGIESKQEKLYSNATMNDDFMDDTVIVIMKEKYSD